MSINLTSEFKGFTRFLSRAREKLISWYGSHCGNDAAKIAFMASKEWDGMADLERKPFIKNDRETKSPLRSLMQSSDENGIYTASPDHRYIIEDTPPGHACRQASRWNSVLGQEDEDFDCPSASELGMKHVIEGRDKLHRLYSPRDLNILEFILKTKPRWPISSRLWFLRTESKYIQSSDMMKRWFDLSEGEKSLYERCAVLDSKRYTLEKNAWVTKIITADLGNDEFTLSDFDLSDIKARIESMGSIVELSKDLSPLIGLKRPREPFSIFIEAFQYQIRERRPKFQFGQHLRDCSEAWKNLTEEEKQFYRDESQRLKENRRRILQDRHRIGESKLSVPVELFSPNKAVYGPCRPSHLYPRLPSILTYWATKNNIKEKPVKPLWNSLDPEVKKSVASEYAKLEKSVKQEREMIDMKHAEVKRLLRDAKKLEALKRQLHLIGQSKRPVKNLYV